MQIHIKDGRKETRFTKAELRTLKRSREILDVVAKLDQDVSLDTILKHTDEKGVFTYPDGPDITTD